MLSPCYKTYTFLTYILLSVSEATMDYGGCEEFQKHVFNITLQQLQQLCQLALYACWRGRLFFNVKTVQCSYTFVFSQEISFQGWLVKNVAFATKAWGSVWWQVFRKNGP